MTEVLSSITSRAIDLWESFFMEWKRSALSLSTTCREFSLIVSCLLLLHTAPRSANFPFSWLFIMPCELYWLRTLAYTRQYISDLETTLFRLPLKQLGELVFFCSFFVAVALAGDVLSADAWPCTSWVICQYSPPLEFLHVAPRPQFCHHGWSFHVYILYNACTTGDKSCSEGKTTYGILRVKQKAVYVNCSQS